MRKAIRAKQRKPEGETQQMKHIFTRIALGLVFGALLNGCTLQRSLFEPKEMPEELVASSILRTPSPVLRGNRDLIRIISIDGRNPKYLDNKVVVSPGQHVVQVSVELRKNNPDKPEEVSITRADTSLQIAVEPGKDYLIDAFENDKGVFVWAVDAENNFVVAGKRPREKVN